METTVRDALSVEEFCESFGLSRAFVYRLWKQNEGPPKAKIGSRTVIPRNAAIRWLEANATSTTSSGESAPEASQNAKTNAA